MLPSLEEFLKLLDIEDKEAFVFKILGFILDFWLAGVAYKWLGGELVLMKSFNQETVYSFLTSQNLFIPIITFILIWLFFHKFVRGIIRFIVWILFAILYEIKISPFVNSQKENAIIGIKFLLSTAIKVLPINVNIRKLSEEKTEENMDEAGDGISDNIEIRYDRIVFYIQFIIIYSYVLSGFDILNGTIDFIIKIILWLSLFGNIIVVFLGYVFERMWNHFTTAMISFVKEEKQSNLTS